MRSAMLKASFPSTYFTSRTQQEGKVYMYVLEKLDNGS
jgi:hypothetical protein